MGGERAIQAAVVAVVYAWSAWRPYDVATWWMEVAPVLVALPFLVWIDRRLELTRLVRWLLVLELSIVALGAHHTYARVPFGFWLGDVFGFERNHYDRIAHFTQGAIPALALREVLLKTSPLGSGCWLFTLVTASCLAASAVYELIEWWAALVFGSGAIEFLGTQGDPWDTQWDMFLALAGAVLAQVVLAGRQDRTLARPRA